MVKIAFSVDDFAPKIGYGLLFENGPFKYMKKLHDEFGAEFTVFTIPQFHGDKNCSVINNKEWCDKVNRLEWLEVAAHGYHHLSPEKKFGEQELYGYGPEDTMKLISQSKKDLESVGFTIELWKSPGWATPPWLYAQLLEAGYSGIADHFVGTKTINHNGLIRIPYVFCIHQIYHDVFDEDDVIILHSHISPVGGNLNSWNQENYDKVREFIIRIQKKYDNVEFITMGDLL